MFHNIKYGIKSIIKWFPVIWNDRPWDEYFLYTILKHKLVLMEKFFRKEGITISSPKKAKEIKKCILVLERLINQDYHINAYKKHDEKWGDLQINLKGRTKNSYNVLLTRPNIVTTEDEEKERKESLICGQHQNYLEEQDLFYLFEQMKKHIRGWWD